MPFLVRFLKIVLECFLPRYDGVHTAPGVSGKGLASYVGLLLAKGLSNPCYSLDFRIFCIFCF